MIDARRAELELREDGVRVDAAERAVAPLVMFEVGVGEGDEGVRRLGGLRVATVLAMMRETCQVVKCRRFVYGGERKEKWREGVSPLR